MRRWGPRSSPSPAGPGDQAVDDPPAGEQPLGTAGGDPEVWRETWERSEAERVARWLESKTHRHSGERQAAELWASAPGGEAVPRPDREEYRRSLVAGVESARQEVEAQRQQEREARSVLEAEIRSLERQRRRMAADLELREAEGDHVRREHLEVRGRLTAELEHLEGRRRELAVAGAEARAGLDAVREDHDAGLARLQAEIAALNEERALAAAALGAARMEAAAECQAAVDEHDRLEHELRALGEERAQAAVAVEVARAGAEAARQADVDERTRIEKEIRALRAEEGRMRDDAADRDGPGGTPKGRGAGQPRVLDPSGKLAASVAELGCHLAAILERERAQAARRAAERRQIEALLGSRRAARAEGSDPHPRAAEAPSPASRRRRRGNRGR